MGLSVVSIQPMPLLKRDHGREHALSEAEGNPIGVTGVMKLSPIFHGQIFDSVELFCIVRDETYSVGHGDRGDL
jgi:hypothetical protein